MIKNKKQQIQERKSRIIARGEHSNHCHVVVGDATVTKDKTGDTIVNIEDSVATLRHLIETKFVEDGKEIWTKEHHDIPIGKSAKIPVGKSVRQGDVVLKKIAANKFKYLQQKELDLNTLQVRDVID